MAISRIVWMVFFDNILDDIMRGTIRRFGHENCKFTVPKTNRIARGFGYYVRYVG
jgi:hypothetical protein